jgi:hypothetical protein
VIHGDTIGLWLTVLSVAISCNGDDLGTDASALLGDVVLVDFLGGDGSCEGSDEREFVEEHGDGWQFSGVGYIIEAGYLDFC